MKRSAVIRLTAVAVLCVDLAHSLECYFCSSPTPALQCMTRMNCSDLQTWCFINVYGPAGYPFEKNRIVVKGCADHCDASNPNNLGITKPTICCQKDLCNAPNKVPAARVINWETFVIGISTATLLHNWR